MLKPIDYRQTYVVSQDKYLLMVHGPSKAVAAARETLNGTSHSFCTVHGENVLRP